MTLDPVQLTRQLIDIESTTYGEGAVGAFLAELLASRDFAVERMHVANKGEDGATSDRFNVYATVPGEQPEIVFSTHMDTVPPFFGSREDDEAIYGRGACDAKGIIAAQIVAVERLRAGGVKAGMLFVVGEERDSAGAKIANEQPRGNRYLINGEPTDNRLGLASKGALRGSVRATGKMAHSAYPELGESAIDKLVEALHRLDAMQLPANPEVGPCTKNVGLLEGGRAPNVIPDLARAELFYRLVGPSEELRRRIVATVGNLAEVNFTVETPFVKLRTLEGLPTMVAAFTTDVPSLTNWGEPLLIGPGSIHVAHTEGEYVEKQQLVDAVELYCGIAKRLVESVPTKRL
jgi:acetylornithine deacetylase